VTTPLTNLGFFGTPRAHNPADFERLTIEKATGRYTRLGLFGVPARWYAIAPVPEVTFTKRVEFAAPIAVEIEPFDDWIIMALMPAPVSGTVSDDFGIVNAEIDRVEIEARSTYVIRVEYL
jgi:hypothetical protein